MIDKEADGILNAELKKHFDSDRDIEMANLILEGKEIRVCMQVF